ncbi:MAG: hypothetical protein OEX07_06850, partial [Gammaproteobacteria bacterium]|nr:hypothetical protein [Gammaproteobacteria bacterium]
MASKKKTSAVKTAKNGSVKSGIVESDIVESDIVESDIVVTGTDGGVDREAVSASDIRSDSKAESSQTT